MPSATPPTPHIIPKRLGSLSLSEYPPFPTAMNAGEELEVLLSNFQNYMETLESDVRREPQQQTTMY